MWLLPIFILVPLVEIGLFIEVGGALGLWPTLAIVLITAIVGTALMRAQGRRAWRDIQLSMREFRDPSGAMAHGAMIVFAGAMLLTPGFFTDACGLLLLIPSVRQFVIRQVGRRMAARVVRSRPAGTSSFVVDGEYEVYDQPAEQPEVIEGDDVRPRPGPSGWTNH